MKRFFLLYEKNWGGIVAEVSSNVRHLTNTVFPNYSVAAIVDGFEDDSAADDFYTRFYYALRPIKRYRVSDWEKLHMTCALVEDLA